jgi:hypothetical protein
MAVVVSTVVSSVALASTATNRLLGFPKPTTYRTTPDPQCRQSALHVRTGKTWTVQRTWVPGHAGLTATALTPRRIRVDWVLAAPAKCSVAFLLVIAGRYSGTRWAPTSKTILPHGQTRGSLVLTIPPYLDPPDVVIARTFNERDVEDLQHGVDAVLIRR